MGELSAVDVAEEFVEVLVEAPKVHPALFINFNKFFGHVYCRQFIHALFVYSTGHLLFKLLADIVERNR